MTQSPSAEVGRGKLPSDIHAALVDTLFGTTGSFISGLVGGLLVPAIAWTRSHDPIFLTCTLILFALATLRIVIFWAYERTPPHVRAVTSVRIERLYALGAIGFMSMVGVTAALLFHRHHDQIATLYAMVLTMGCVGSTAGRNAGRPLIVYAQMVGVLVPLAVTLVLNYSLWYWGLAVLLMLTLASVRSTTKSLNGVLVSALLNGREARIQRARFSSALDSMSHGLCMGDKDGAITVINHRLQEFFNLDPSANYLTAGGLAQRISASGSRSPASDEAFVRKWETHVAKRDTSVFSETIGDRIYDFRCEPMDEGGFVVVVEDVTAARISSREIERMAHFDPLTDLPNRMQFHAQMEACFNAPGGLAAPLVLLSIDLDQFKEVNDARGHPTGDALLREVARRLQAVAGGALVARFGGDEFQVLLRTPTEVSGAEVLAQAIIDSLTAAYCIDGHAISIGASVGIAAAPRDAGDADELLRCADMALYQAKAEGRGAFRCFEPALDAAMRRKRAVEQDLREALARDELEVHYQPVVDTRTGQIVACEALVRMRRAGKGMVPPQEFIGVAEESGLIVELGDWVLRRACRDAMAWPKHVRVAVNFSPKQFVIGKDVVGGIRKVLAETGLDASRLEVEITESTIIEAKDALRQLGDISAAGIKISLDDFGTGYSSLSYLRQFPVDKIKIDRSFAQDLKARASQAVVGSVSVLAHLLDVELVIEGIETREQLEAVMGWNVHLIQGYYFSRPKPLQDVMPLLRSPEPFAPVTEGQVRDVA